MGLAELKTQQVVDTLGKKLFVVFRRKTVRCRQIKLWFLLIRCPDRLGFPVKYQLQQPDQFLWCVLISFSHKSVLITGVDILVRQFPETLIQQIFEILKDLINHEQGHFDLFAVGLNEIFDETELVRNIFHPIDLDLKLHDPLGDSF
jgi:hypothetical protein